MTSARLARIAKWGSVPAGLLLSALLVWQASYAAFSATTSNPENNWRAGSVELTDDAAGAAMFNADGLTPGASGENFIVGTYKGTVPATVKLYAADASTTKNLAEHLQIEIVSGAGGGFNSGEGFAPDQGAPVFEGTLAEFTAAHTNFANGIQVDQATESGSKSTTYRFRYTLSPDAPNTVQGGTAGLGFTWEAQSS